MEWTASEDLIAIAIGRTAMNFMNRVFLAETVNTAATQLLDEIQEILNDDRLDDPECFYKIDAIVSAFRQRGIDVYRHDFG